MAIRSAVKAAVWSTSFVLGASMVLPEVRAGEPGPGGALEEQGRDLRAAEDLPRSLSVLPLEGNLPVWALPLREEGGEPDVQGPAQEKLSDLTLLNFFTEGWGEPWAHRHRKTPDMALLRVTTNFLEREFRFDWQGARHIDRNAKLQRTDFVQALIAYGLDRRIMIEVIGSYQWNHKDGLNIVDGPGMGGLVRFQLVDTETASYAVQMKAIAPNKSIGQTGATLSPAVAGWNDLDAAIGLDRVGLYYSINWDNVSGPHAHPAQTNVLSYDISLAKTWTELRTPVLGNLTTFLEGLAAQNGDGPQAHHTGVTLTPGIRFWFVPENSLTFGVDLPVSYPHPNSEVWRITYILNF